MAADNWWCAFVFGSVLLLLSSLSLSAFQSSGLVSFTEIYQMATIIARLPCPPLMVVDGKQPISGAFQKLALPAIRDRKERLSVTAKASGESSETSIIKSIQNVWDNSEDRLGLIGLGFAGVIGLWASINLIGAVDRLPILPSALELIGILYSSWFTYRYLLFKPDRQELSRLISKSISDILGK